MIKPGTTTSRRTHADKKQMNVVRGMLGAGQDRATQADRFERGLVGKLLAFAINVKRTSSRMW